LFIVAVNTDRNFGLYGSDVEPDALRSISPALASRYVAEVRERLDRLAAVTGGRVHYPRTVAEGLDAYESVGRQLGLSYNIEYSPTRAVPDGTLRRISVRVNRPGTRVIQSRQSYIAR
jgi:hypothetical protein